MSTVPKSNSGKKMTTTIQGREVILYFADQPNPQVAAQVQQALLGAYFPSKR